jgi:arylsulfatase A-like enzyme
MAAGFLDELERLGTRDRTLVILLSDHGEAFDEHGLFGHGNGFQQEQLHIPLVFSGPGVGQGVRQSSVGITDVASTVLDLAGVESPVTGSGRSLATLVRSGRDAPETGPEPRPLFFTWLHTDADGARLGPRKLIDDGDRCVEYDLDDDPLEEHPREVRCDESEIARRIAEYRRRTPRERGAAPEAPGEAVSIPPDVERSLRALGYLQ